MRPELETYHQIDSYLNGKLEGEALRAFEEKLRSDPEFADEVSFQQLTNEVVVGASYDNLRSQMTKDIHSIDLIDKTKKWSLYAITTFVLLTGAFGIFYYSDKKANNQDIKEQPQSTAQSSISTQVPNDPITSDSKSIQKEILHNNIAAKEQIPANTDTQATVTSVPQIPIHTPVVKTTDAKTIQPVEQPTNTNPCLHVQLDAKIAATPSCANESNGSILINTITGGTKPYHISIDELPVSTKTKESYFYLKSETYTVRIADANGCVKTVATAVHEKTCKKNVYVFAPEKGETWKISGTNNDEYTVTIINIAGTQVYKSHLIQGEFEWQGIGQQGEYLSGGLYIYVIEYTNGQKENGQVTIVR